MNVDLYNKKGEKKSKINLNDQVFSIEPNEHTIYLAVKSELAAKRQGTSSSKTRGEVRGGGAKPWKQKGTGRARVGSTRNPSRVHGGSVFGPKPHKFNLKVNKKVKNNKQTNHHYKQCGNDVNRTNRINISILFH